MTVAVLFCGQVSAQTVLIGTYDVNYRYNAGACPPSGPTSDPTIGNPYYCEGTAYGPGPIKVNAAPGRYRVVTKGFGPNCACTCPIWSGDASSGLRYQSAAAIDGFIEFDHTFGQIVFYYWDWFAGDNSPGQSTRVELYRMEATPPPDCDNS